MYTFESIVLQCIASVLPVTRLDAADTLRNSFTSILAPFVGVVVTMAKFVERFCGDFAKEQKTSAITQVRVAVSCGLSSSSVWERLIVRQVMYLGHHLRIRENYVSEWGATVTKCTHISKVYTFPEHVACNWSYKRNWEHQCLLYECTVTYIPWGGAIRRPCVRIPAKFVVREPCHSRRRSPLASLSFPAVVHASVSSCLSTRNAFKTSTDMLWVWPCVFLTYSLSSSHSCVFLETGSMDVSRKDRKCESIGLSGFPLSSLPTVAEISFEVTSCSRNTL